VVPAAGGHPDHPEHPRTGPAPAPGQAGIIARETADGGRLHEVLRATSAHPGVTWAVDPALLTTAAADGASSGAGWTADLLRSTSGREVQLLPWGDADLAALAHAGGTALTQLAEERSTKAATDLGLAASNAFSLPGAATTDLTTATASSAGGSRAVVVAPGELPPPSVLTYTPSALATTSSGATTLRLLVPDLELSQSMATGTTAGGAAGQLSGASAAAELLAELAIITRERPSDGRHLLASLPRHWSPSPSSPPLPRPRSTVGAFRGGPSPRRR